MDDEPLVKLVPSFVWHCPNCQVLQLSYPVVAEITNEEAQELVDNYGGDIEEYKTGYTCCPATVTCDLCEQEFHCTDATDDNEDDEANVYVDYPDDKDTYSQYDNDGESDSEEGEFDYDGNNEDEDL